MCEIAEKRPRKEVDEAINQEYEELKSNWVKFIAKFKNSAPKIYSAKRNVFMNLVSEERTVKDLVEKARGTHTFVSTTIWELLEEFMDSMKRIPGKEGENYQKLYDEMTSADLVKRLMTKRPIVFFKKTDDYMLRNVPKIGRGKGTSWNFVARTLKENVKGMPYLEEYISYDEMLLSALIGVATPTYFVSDGSMKDPHAAPVKPYVPEGVLCALIGARLCKEDFMENRFAVLKENHSEKFEDVHRNDSFWIRNVYPDAFPEGKIPTKTEVTKNPKIYEKIYRDNVNVVFLEKRLMLSIVPFLYEACSQGEKHGKNVFVSVPGIGAGVWKGPVKAALIHELIVIGVLQKFEKHAKDFENIAGLYLPVVHLKVYENYKPKNSISNVIVDKAANKIIIKFKGTNQKLTIFNQMRYVAAPLPKEFENCLVVASYAYDSNSYPGNNYWVDSFSSFDPQAMICSLLSQFQNPEVNVKFLDRIEVNGAK